jgi:sodium-dependent dicarboxylate transporter 2/3/5
MAEEVQNGFDVLDMNNYKMEKLPIRDKSKFEKTLMKIGSPLAIVSFISILYIFDFSFLRDLMSKNCAQRPG